MHHKPPTRIFVNAVSQIDRSAEFQSTDISEVQKVSEFRPLKFFVPRDKCCERLVVRKVKVVDH